MLFYTLYRDLGSYDSDFIEVESVSYIGIIIVTGLTPGLNYHFKTTATNIIGESDFSSEISRYSASLPE